jgi:hypothetical protein
MMVFAMFLGFGILPIFIFCYKYYEIREVMKKNNCSILEAIKLYAKQHNSRMQLSSSSFDGNQGQYKSTSSNYHYGRSSYNDDHRHSPSYSYLPQNIHHKF